MLTLLSGGTVTKFCLEAPALLGPSVRSATHQKALRWVLNRSTTDLILTSGHPFHSGGMIAQIDYNNQLIVYSIHFIAVTCAYMLVSSVDYRQTTTGRAGANRLGAD
jgi:hypothetical protein